MLQFCAVVETSPGQPPLLTAFCFYRFGDLCLPTPCPSPAAWMESGSTSPTASSARGVSRQASNCRNSHPNSLPVHQWDVVGHTDWPTSYGPAGRLHALPASLPLLEWGRMPVRLAHKLWASGTSACPACLTAPAGVWTHVGPPADSRCHLGCPAQVHGCVLLMWPVWGSTIAL